MLVGNRHPYSGRHAATAAERETFNRRRAHVAAQAAAGMDVKETLSVIRHPGWRWHGE